MLQQQVEQNEWSDTNNTICTLFRPNYVQGKEGQHICCLVHCTVKLHCLQGTLHIWIVFIIDYSIDCNLDFIVKFCNMLDNNDKFTFQVPRVQGDIKNQE